MKRFDQLISPLSWLILITAFTALLYVLLTPSPLELGLLFVVDYLALLMIQPLDRWLFTWLYPQTRPFFPVTDQTWLAQANDEQKMATFEALRKFPSQRALYCALLSYLKAVPGLVVVIVYWRHGRPLGPFLIELLAIISLVYSYFYGVVFIENHSLVSARIREYHEAYDWTDSFRKECQSYPHSEFELPETVSVLSVWLCATWVLWMLMTEPEKSPTVRGCEAIMVLVFATVLLIRIWYLVRRFFFDGLSTILAELQKLEPNQIPKTLPLHSSPILANFERSYNALTDRLRSYQKELEHWIGFQTEESRFRALGEISAVIVHDLSGPLHVINFCTQELRRTPSRLPEVHLMDQLETNGSRAIELITSLRSYLRNEKIARAYCVFGDAYRDAIRLVQSRFYEQKFSSIKMTIEPEISNLAVAMTKPDLIHVLTNLLDNSFENLLTYQIPNPEISLLLRERDGKHAQIVLSDNGTGLEAGEFERLTAFSSPPADGDFQRAGLGLRLIRRLIERNSGSLTAHCVGSPQIGTALLLSLPVFSEEENQFE